MNVARLLLGRSKVVVFVVLVLAAFGVHAYFVASQSIFPAMSFARIDVVADAGNLTPERVRVAVTRPLETAFGTLPSATRVRANSTQGSAEILVDFDTKTNPRVDLQYVQSAIAAIAPSIPAAKSIQAVIVNPNAEPVVSYGLVSSVLSQAALNQFITTRIVPAFAGTPGLGRTSVVGGPPIEYRVELNPASLAALGLASADVAAAIADANNVQSVGTAERYHQRYVVLVDAALHDARSLASVGIPLKSGGTVPLSSLGTVTLGVGTETAQASVDGRHAVIVNFFALPGADVVALTRAVEARLGHVRSALPADVKIVKYWDQTRLIVDSQTSLRDAILLGALLAVIVIYFFLRSLRMTLVAAAIIPLALSIAILALERSGQSLNLMSVGGLAVAVGLIIDDTIVVIEAIARGISEHPNDPRGETIATSVGRIAGAMAASTLTTVVVFVPLGLLSGVTGFFFRALAFTLSISLIVSLALAVGVAPIIASALLRGTTPHAERPDALNARYQPVLRWALSHRPIVFGCAALVLVTTFVLLARLPSDFLPKLDEGEFEIKYSLPAGATLRASDEAAAKMETIVRNDPDVTAVGRLTGVDTNGFSPTQPSTGFVRVVLTTGKRASYDVIAGRMREAINAAVPAASLDFHQLLEDQINDLSGAPQPVEIAITGPDQAKLIEYADATTRAISKVPGVVDAFDGVIYDDPSLRVSPHMARLGALGITGTDLGNALAARTQGNIATQIPGEVATIPVRVRVAGPQLAADALGTSNVFTKSGTTPIAALARIDRPARSSDVNEENGRRIVRVTANIEGASLSAVIAGVKPVIAHLGLAPGYRAAIGGAYETQQASFREFLSVIAIAIVLVFSVMLGTFHSFRLPMVILCAIPLALIGVALALSLTGTPFNVSSFMGLLLLVGIVVKNGILLIDVANVRRTAGDDVTTALITAGSTRLRPIVMTTLAAIGGLFPLALGLGAGAEMEKPLAIAVIGGLSTATIFTLIVIPVLYATFIGDARVRGPRGAGAAVVSALLALALFVPVRVDAQRVAAERFTQIDLPAAQALALVSSPDVRVAQGNLAAARATLAQARGTSGLAAVAGYSETPQGSAEGTIASRITSYGAQVTLGDLTALSPLIAQAAATVRAAQTDEVVAERAERVRTIELYFGALKARAVASARGDALASAQRQLDAANKRVNAGDAPRLDVVRAQVSLSRARADLALARAADASASDALAREVDRPTTLLANTTSSASFAALIPTPQAAVALALAQRADIASANSNVRAAAAGVRAARTGTLPPITLGAGYARGVDSGVRIGGPTMNASIAFPLGGAASARVHAQEALRDVAVAKRDGIMRSVALEVGAAARTASATVEAESATNDALVAAKAELDATSLGYANGASTSLDVSTSRSTYVQAAVDALAARYDRLQAQAVLTLEVGS